MNVTHLSMLSRFRIVSMIRSHSRGTRQLHFLSCTYFLNHHHQQNPLRQIPVLYQSVLINKERLCCSNNQLHHGPIELFHSATSFSSRESNIPALKPSEITYAEFEICAEETLDSLTEYFEDLPESESCNDDYDCAYGTGVLTVHLGSVEGTYVINKQSPNKQIWLSSPLSGPKRFDYVDGQWVYLRDGKVLHHLLEEELTEIMGIKIELKKCKYYSLGTPDAK